MCRRSWEIDAVLLFASGGNLEEELPKFESRSRTSTGEDDIDLGCDWEISARDRYMKRDKFIILFVKKKKALEELEELETRVEYRQARFVE
ncbi:hypothetical protein EYC80_009027 [Monilinia laxa]|uniref:Uncharacterized protein n=1 Tax=Monilinia laxa TaxID=61186 RepID=A0A5N6K264_MONLA|nr:hypothetical protein EYC80_009027 [Monilinia laxa]